MTKQEFLAKMQEYNKKIAELIEEKKEFHKEYVRNHAELHIGDEAVFNKRIGKVVDIQPFGESYCVIWSPMKRNGELLEAEVVITPSDFQNFIKINHNE